MIRLGLVGEKLSHSISPEMHRLILEKLGLEGEYKLYEVGLDKLGERIMELKAEGIRGLNVTIPYKISVMDFLDEISPEAESIGSVNTITFDGNGLKGYNTDYFGFKSTLESFEIDIENKCVAIIGTGGVAAAVYQCVSDLGAAGIRLVSRNKSELKELWKNKKVDVINYEELQGYKGNVIINCTPVGMYPNTEYSPVGPEVMKGYEAAVDLIYNPRETRFLSFARALGMKAAGGLHMLIGQALKSEEIWNGIKINHNIAKCIDKNFK